jgi:hypothetical protein
MTLQELKAEIQRRLPPDVDFCCDSFDDPSTWCWKCLARLLVERMNELPNADLRNIDDYHNAPSGIGPQAAEWKDKPHRLIYDLCGEIRRLRGDPPFSENA